MVPFRIHPAIKLDFLADFVNCFSINKVFIIDFFMIQSFLYFDKRVIFCYNELIVMKNICQSNIRILTHSLLIVEWANAWEKD